MKSSPLYQTLFLSSLRIFRTGVIFVFSGNELEISLLVLISTALMAIYFTVHLWEDVRKFQATVATSSRKQEVQWGGKTNNWGKVISHFMALKWISNLNGCHSPTVGQKYKSRYSLENKHWDISSDYIFFLINTQKVLFKSNLQMTKNSTFFQVTTFWLIVNHPVWDWIRNLNQLVDMKMQKTQILTKNW